MKPFGEEAANDTRNRWPVPQNMSTPSMMCHPIIIYSSTICLIT